MPFPAADNPAFAGTPSLVQGAGYVGIPAPPLATIFHTLEDHLTLVPGDRVLIDAGTDKHLQVGDRLTVFRPTTAVQHPRTAQLLGALVATLGVATVVSVQPTLATLQITRAFEGIQVGDRVKPFVPPPPVSTPAAVASPSRAIAGLVIALKDEKFVAATGDTVYLDRGEQHGVVIGDRFDVLQENHVVRHPLSAQLLPVPLQTLGTLTVVDVRSRTATALVTSSRREFSVGAPVVLSSPLTMDQVAAVPGVGTELSTRAETGLAQLVSCLEAARQAILAAEAAGLPATELTTAQTALARAELLYSQAQQALGRGEYEQAVRFLDQAQADCQTAQALHAPTSPAARPEQYRVQRGDTLWGISARPLIYANPLLWPLIYQANRRQLRDPDLIFPRQLLAIPRHYSPEQAQLASRQARQRGRWRLHDGPDRAVLEGGR
jgi:hypothetical protein